MTDTTHQAVEAATLGNSMPEINFNNYNLDDVHKLQQWALEAATCLQELTLPQEVAAEVGNRTHVDSGALTMALNVLRRAGKDEVANALELTASRSPAPAGVAGGVDAMRQHVEDFATRAGWKREDGEGAFEYVQRKCYAQGREDATQAQPSPHPAVGGSGGVPDAWLIEFRHPGAPDVVSKVAYTHNAIADYKSMLDPEATSTPLYRGAPKQGAGDVGAVK